MNTTDSATPQAQTQDVVSYHLNEVTNCADEFRAMPCRSLAARLVEASFRGFRAIHAAFGWRPMAEAPAGDVSAVIDIWDGERRIPDCFWSETDKCWLFEDWDGAHYINVAVTDPQAWMWTPKAPEGL